MQLFGKFTGQQRKNSGSAAPAFGFSKDAYIPYFCPELND
jgi:hypothetical protein